MPATTLLEAINTLLAAIGSSPVTSIDTSKNADAIMAKNHIDRALKDIQAEQWYFNTETNFPLIPDTTGEINLPKNLISIDHIGQFGLNSNLVPRGNKLYDRSKHTYTIDGTVTANITLCLSFDEIPETAALYVIARAARKYQEEMLGDPSLRTWTKDDELQARGRLLDEHLRATKAHFGVLPRLDPNVAIDGRNDL